MKVKNILLTNRQVPIDGNMINNIFITIIIIMWEEEKDDGEKEEKIFNT